MFVAFDRCEGMYVSEEVVVPPRSRSMSSRRFGSVEIVRGLYVVLFVLPCSALESARLKYLFLVFWLFEKNGWNDRRTPLQDPA